MRARLADDHGEFAFVLDALENIGEERWDRRGRRWRWRLQEDQRFLGDFIAEFGGVSGVVAADADDFAGFDGGEQSHVGQRPHARALRPLPPGRPGNFADLFAFDQAVERKDGLQRRRIHRERSGKISYELAGAVAVAERDARRALPDAGADPGERGENHVENRAEHENLKRSVPIADRPEK